MAADLCPCIYPDIDWTKDQDDDLDADLCECGHVLDEHDEQGQCTVELEESP